MRATFVLWAVALIFPLPLVLLLNVQMTDSWAMRASISLGLISYAWWLLAILLSVRPSWLDRRVGLPTIYALHGALGVIALIPAYFHRENTFAPSRLAQALGDWGFYVALAVLCYSVLFVSGWLTDRSRLIKKAKRGLEIFFRHQLSVWIHRLNLVVVVAIWWHVHLIERVNQHFAFMVLFDVYTVVVLGIYVWKKWNVRDAHLTGVVHENIALGPTLRRLVVALDRPATTARPGDFYFARFEGVGDRSDWHPFSATDERQDVLTFTIRQLGDFTSELGNAVVGTRVTLDGPFGRFDRLVAGHPENSPLVFVGMGAGVAPLASLTAAHSSSRRIHLLWAIHSSEDAHHSDALDGYRARSGGKLRVTTQVGRFSKDHFSPHLSPKEITSGAFFVVGPGPAVLATQRTLRQLGVKRNRIHHERLTM